MIASTAYVIIDLEYPRQVLIQMSDSDQVLFDLRSELECHDTKPRRRRQADCRGWTPATAQISSMTCGQSSSGRLCPIPG